MPYTRALIAEAIGTFALCFVGLLAIGNLSIIGAEGSSSLAAVALAHGLTITVMVAALSHHSGAHFNPAVTFGFLITRRMEPLKAGLYFAAQIFGATLGSALVAAMYDFDAAVLPGPGISWAGVVVTEAVATFFLVLVVFGTAVDERAPRSVYPFAIGLVIAANILAIGPLTGAAMNPARALGPALVANVWEMQWVYWIGPLLGGALAALLQDRVLLERAPSPEVAERGGPAPSEQRD